MTGLGKIRFACALALVSGAAAITLFALAMHDQAQAFIVGPTLRSMANSPDVLLVQNPFTPFTLPQAAEPPVSPINPGSLPGSTAAIGGSAIGTNPITGLPCNGSGSLSVSGAGGLPGTATPPPGTTETLDQLPIGAPPVTSIYGSQSNLGSC